MAYIGRQPQIGNFQICDAISTVNNQAAYTMQVSSVNVEPETANHMIVSLNGVIQKPNSSYTVAGAVITFSSALVTGDVINFIQILGSVLDLGVPSDDTVTAAKLSSNAVTTVKILDSNITTAKILDNNITTAKILNSNVTTAKVADNAVTLAKMASGTDGNIISYDTSGNPVAVATGSNGQVLTSAGAGAVPSFQAASGGTNTPAFYAFAGSGDGQTLTHNTEHKMIFGTESFDTDNRFASNRFTPVTAGTYYLDAHVYITAEQAVTQLQGSKVKIFKNGSVIAECNIDTRSGDPHYIHHMGVSTLDVADSNDYYEVYAQVLDNTNGASGTDLGYTYFTGFKLIT